MKGFKIIFGEGGLGEVYYGEFFGEIEVVVKRLQSVIQGDKEF